MKKLIQFIISKQIIVNYVYHSLINNIDFLVFAIDKLEFTSNLHQIGIIHIMLKWIY